VHGQVHFFCTTHGLSITLPTVISCFSKSSSVASSSTFSRSGRPISSTNDQNVEVVRAVMAKDRRLSVRMIAEELALDRNAVHRFPTDHLHVQKSCAKLVSKDLSVEKNANRLEICQYLLERLEIEPNFLAKVITGE
jgi:hypothetical protein